MSQYDEGPDLTKPVGPPAGPPTPPPYQGPPQGSYAPPPSGPSWSPPSSQAVQREAKGFLGALFDFGFNHFVTPMIIKVVYVIATVALVLAWLFFLVVSFSQSAVAGLFVLIVGPLFVILYLAVVRMTLEFYLAVVRMSEDIHQRLK